jgi:hypothetical protein
MILWYCCSHMWRTSYRLIVEENDDDAVTDMDGDGDIDELDVKVLLCLTKSILTVLIFLTEIILTVLICFTEIILIVLTFVTGIITVLIFLTEVILTVLLFSY